MDSTPTRPTLSPAALRESTVQILLGDAARLADGVAVVEAADGWDAVVALAEAWRVIPRLQERLRDIALPERAAGKLRETLAASAAESAWVCHGGARAIAQLTRHGIPTSAFKGMAAIAHTYRGPGERMVRDVDLLVSEEDLERTCEVLAPLGFKTFFEGSLAAWLEHVERRTDLDNAYLVLVGPENLQLDIHWRVGGGRGAERWTRELIERSRTVELLGEKVRVVDPIDAQCLTVHHALHDHLTPASLVKDLCDLVAWWRVQPALWGPADLATAARAAGLATPLLAFWNILASLDADSKVNLATGSMADAGADSRLAGEIEAAFWSQLRNGPLNRDLLLLANPRMAWAQFRSRLSHRAEDLFYREALVRRVGLPESTWPPLGERIAALVRALIRGRGLRSYRAVLRSQNDAQLFDRERARG